MTLSPRNICYQYDGSLDGLLCCVFAAFEQKALPRRIVKSGEVQLSLDDALEVIETNLERALRVEEGIRRRIGPEALELVHLCARSIDPDAVRIAIRYVELGFAVGPRIDQRLTDPAVLDMNRITRAVTWESYRWRQFARFSALEGGIYIADIHPENDVLTLLVPHFVERFGIQPFIIHDENRLVAAVWDTKEWRLVDSAHMHLPARACDDAAYQALWKAFYHAIGIKQRENPKLRRNFMPKKYWKNMTEMQVDFRTIGDREKGRLLLEQA